MKLTMRSRPDSRGKSSAALMPSIIMVPPLPCKRSTYSRPRRMFSGVASTGREPRAEAFSEKRMIWKLSPSRSWPNARRMADLDFSIGQPFMLPEQSRTNTNSTGARRRPSSEAGGTSIIVKKPSSP